MKRNQYSGRLDVLFSEIKKNVRVEGESLVSNRLLGGDVTEFLDVIQTYLLDQTTSESERQHCAGKVIRFLAESAEYNQQETERVIRESVAKYRQSIKQEYHAWTRISISSIPRPRLIKTQNGVVRIGATTPDRDTGDISSRIKRLMSTLKENKGAWVKISVSARDHAEAMDAALDELNYFRGLWQLIYTKGSRRMSFGGPHKPIGPFRIGPVHTLHDDTGRLATDCLWYEPSMYTEVKLKTWDKKCEETLKAARSADKMISRHSSKGADELRSCLRLYADALDESRMDIAFLKLWGSLERLTDAVSSSDLLIKRAAFVWDNPGYAREVLTHLARHRHRYVHKGVVVGDKEQHVFQAKRYVDQLFWFLIPQAGIGTSFHEAMDLLDHPIDAKMIKQRIGSLKKALFFANKRARIGRAGE